MKTLRTRLTFANVTSCLALFVALGGFAVAAGLPKNSVGTRQLKKNSVTAAKIKNGAVTGVKINVSTLGTVPSTANAVVATNAQHAQTADAIQAPEALHLIGEAGAPFAPGWEDSSPHVTAGAFYKDREGVVHLQGTLGGHGTEAQAFTLPPGYRPAQTEFFTVPGNGGAPVALVVRETGAVISTDKDQVSIDGTTFRAGQ